MRLVTWLWICLAVALAASVGFFLKRRRTRAWHRMEQQAREKAQAVTEEARAFSERLLAQAQTDAEELRQKRLAHGQRDLLLRRQTLQRAAEQIVAWEQLQKRSEKQLEEKAAALTQRDRAVADMQSRCKTAQDRRVQLVAEAKEMLVRRAGETHAEARARLGQQWCEQVRAAGADSVRQVEQLQNTPELAVCAKRLLDISIQRYEGHYLTERLLSTLPIPQDVLDRVFGKDNDVLEIISSLANVKVQFGEERNSIRLEGQDSLGRELARRTIARLVKLGGRAQKDAAERIVKNFNEDLEREIVEQGRRAFKELAIPRAHPDLVKLVGRLQFRTSYSQNQWKHAVESAFLCGMLAAELRLDVKIARRAALLHDIGKSLTHALDGSHAVIGADHARRLGENEVVANAIGAHHLEEPFGSPYALIVAAADAMSGGRPGARHEQEGSHLQRIEDLERLVVGTPGVSYFYALQAGRELRVHVKENQVNDLKAAQLATALAQKICENLVYPGQIRVTVIREVEIVSTAN